MLERVPEPELMDEAEQAAAYAGADFEASHGAIVEALVARLPDFPEGGAVLDIGCGPADISIRVGRWFPAFAWMASMAPRRCWRRGASGSSARDSPGGSRCTVPCCRMIRCRAPDTMP
jgi:hypothetical protein